MGCDLQSTLHAALVPSTWAAWAAAIGTFCAAWAAVKAANRALSIADRERADREDTRRIQAELTAARLAPILKADADYLRHYAATIGFGDANSAPSERNRDTKALMALQGVSTEIDHGDIIDLEPLGNNCAQHIASAYGLIRHARMQPKPFGPNAGRIGAERDLRWELHLGKAADHLCKAAEICSIRGYVEQFDESDLP